MTEEIVVDASLYEQFPDGTVLVPVDPTPTVEEEGIVYKPQDGVTLFWVPRGGFVHVTSYALGFPKGRFRVATDEERRDILGRLERVSVSKDERNYEHLVRHFERAKRLARSA